jgi:hypothetical protein
MQSETIEMPELVESKRAGRNVAINSYRTTMTSHELADLLNANRDASQLSYGTAFRDWRGAPTPGMTSVVCEWSDSCD